MGRQQQKDITPTTAERIMGGSGLASGTFQKKLESVETACGRQDHGGRGFFFFFLQVIRTLEER